MPPHSSETPDRQLVKIAKALSDGTRLKILCAISRHGEVCCGELARDFGITQATVSHHLRVLGEADLVESRRDGQFIRVRALPSTVERYGTLLSETLCCRGERTAPADAPRADDEASK